MWKTRLLFILVTLASIAVVVGYIDSSIGYILLYTMLILFVLSTLSIVFAPFFIRLDQTAEKTAIMKNERVAYFLNVKNNSIVFYPRVTKVFLNNDTIKYIGNNNVFSLPPLARTSSRYQLSIPYRGIYKSGIKHIEITDFLGIFKVKVKNRKIIPVIAYPECRDDFSLSILNEPQHSAMNMQYFKEEDYTTVADTRKYVNTDNLKKIHWKLSAKRGELIVKNYNPLIPNKVVLFLDIHKLPLSGLQKAEMEDAMASYTASAAGYCTKKHLPAMLLCGLDIANQTEFSHVAEMEKILGVLAVVEFSETGSDYTALLYYGGSNNIVLFMADLNEMKYGTIQNLISYDRKIILYFFYAKYLPVTTEKKEMLDSLREYGVEVMLIEVK